MQISVERTKYMVTDRIQNIQNNGNLVVRDKILKRVSNFKYLNQTNEIREELTKKINLGNTCIYVALTELLYLALHVDDKLVIDKSLQTINKLFNAMNKKFEATYSEYIYIYIYSAIWISKFNVTENYASYVNQHMPI